MTIFLKNFIVLLTNSYTHAQNVVRLYSPHTFSYFRLTLPDYFLQLVPFYYLVSLFGAALA